MLFIMAARPIASGTISFGLVSIPVQLFSASQASERIAFHFLHQKCGSRLKQQYICPKDGEKVERDQMVKGYEYAKDRYVTFTAEELKALEEHATGAIEIVEFVPLAKVDPIYFDKPYYLAPAKGGEKAYRLLAEAMRQTGRSALARYAARGKGYLVLIRPVDGRLVMHQLLYADEVRPFSEVEVPSPELKEAEVKLAVQLVEQISSEEFRPQAYEDQVKKRFQEQIRRKVEGQEVSLAPAEPVGGQIIDLMEALKASLLAKPSTVAAASEERKGPKRAERSESAAPGKAKGSKR